MMFAVLFSLALLQCSTAQYDYGEVLKNSILFFEAQESGVLREGHRVTWRGDSATEDGDDEVDLTGGWYDAGDHVKFNFPMAASTTLIAWGIIDFKEGYEAANELQNALNSLRVPLEYFLKCNVNIGNNNEHYGQVGDGGADHAFWGRPEDMTMVRPAASMTTSGGEWGADLGGETAAALAAGSLAFEDSDGGFAGELRAEAITLFDVAYANQGRYTAQIPADGFYGSSGFDDELCHGAAWLYRLTGDDSYRTIADEFYNSGPAWSLSWDNKYAACQALMHIATGEDNYRVDLNGFLNSWKPGGGITYTPGGLAWRDTWGPNRYAANSAFLAVLESTFGDDDENNNFEWAKGQIDYMLGDNPKDMSYVVGFGNNPPERPHHRSSSCQPDHSLPCSWDDFNNPGPNWSTLYGALVGGPDANDQYEDDRSDYIANEVACDYNAGFQGAVAGIINADIRRKR